MLTLVEHAIRAVATARAAGPPLRPSSCVGGRRSDAVAAHRARRAMRDWGVLIVLLLGAGIGCSRMRGQPFDSALAGRDFYLCCTLGFDARLETWDANYRLYRNEGAYIPRPLLPAGTRVHVTKVGGSALQFQAVGNPATYTFVFAFGRKQMSPSQYFQRILLETDPLAGKGYLPPATVNAIREGRLLRGMTKDQAVLARGYPPAHRTPSLTANDWLYYESGAITNRVTFVDDRVDSVVQESAPQ